LAERLRDMLEVKDVVAGYGEVTVLHGVSLRVGDGEITAVLGPNGAGKTTLLKTVMGLIKPKKGEILFGGKRIDSLRPDQVVSAGVSLALAEKELFPMMTVMENLLLGAFTKRARQKLDENLEVVFELFPRLKERKNQKAGTMSGGEQQMLAIGRALMSDAKLLMLDEPSTGLAPILVENIFNAFKKLMEIKNGMSILLVEQRVDQAIRLAVNCYLMANGRITFSGNIIEDVQSVDFLRKYLGV